ncbi:similar to polyketide synthase [Rhodopirellula baltica SH 1]|uniref:Similar to polyketide synthase n=1 Tax=Rhodopirellula baltica (strain DSM 10527 / NCIMB 13988 / SH1) TaxID=243090 RepID=Q7UGA6_RHOBA|nr:similar to polyketide synthase [Rhodopirellula baltica SH 1]
MVVFQTNSRHFTVGTRGTSRTNGESIETIDWCNVVVLATRVTKHPKRSRAAFDQLQSTGDRIHAPTCDEISDRMTVSDFLKLQPHCFRRVFRWTVHNRTVRDSASDSVVLSHQRRVDHQCRADFVETFCGSIGWQCIEWTFAGWELHRQQVGNRVRVLMAVQSTQTNLFVRSSSQSIHFSQLA